MYYSQCQPCRHAHAAGFVNGCATHQRSGSYVQPQVVVVQQQPSLLQEIVEMEFAEEIIDDIIGDNNE